MSDGLNELLQKQAEYQGEKSPHRVVAMTEHKGILFVATEHYVYRLDGDQLRPLMFVHRAEPAA